MTEPTDPIRDPDTLLADFTDRLLGGDSTGAASSDEELRSLQDTLTRLHRAFPSAMPDEKTRKRLETDIHARIRNSRTHSPGFAWWSGQSRQRVAVAFVAMAVLALVILAPIFWSNPGNIEGTARIPLASLALLIALGGMLFLLIWLGRRK